MRLYKIKDLIGKRFGSLTVLSLDKKFKKYIKWIVRCSCGNAYSIPSQNLGKTKQCILCKKAELDLTGKRFGKFTVIKRAEKTYDNRCFWEVKCDCGYTSIMSGKRLRGNPLRCRGCSCEDLTGRQFGDLTVLRKDHIEHHLNGHRCQRWIVKCVCRKEYSSLGSVLRSGGATRCIDCRRDSPNTLPGYMLQRIKHGARLRNLKFDKRLTKQYLYDLFLAQNKKCALSGVVIEIKGYNDSKAGLTTASLDRINSKIGYEPNNIQWVHKDVNLIKNKFDQSYFISICHAIASRNPIKQI